MPLPNFTYQCSLVKIVDADTLVLRIDLGFHVSIVVTVRVRGVDAPELRTPEGDTAKAAVVRWFEANPAIVVATYKDRNRMSFNRWVADVYLDGELLTDRLRAAGLVKP